MQFISKESLIGNQIRHTVRHNRTSQVRNERKNLELN